jgi:hypothetical protein
MHTSVISETYLRGGHARATSGFYAAEAGINRGMGDYRNIFLSFAEPSGSDFGEKLLTIGPRTVRYKLTEACGDADADGEQDCPLERRIPAGRPFAGLNSQLFTYIANATSEVNSGDVEVTLGTQFDVNNIPLFQFLAFYENDLEILPGQAMTLNGPIHTNGSLYLNSSGSTLNIQDNQAAGIYNVSVTARNDVYRGRKDGGACDGVVSIDKLADANLDGSLDPLSMTCGGLKPPSALTSWLGAIRSNQPYVAVPSPDVLQRGTGDYWTLADLRIALDLNQTDAQGYKRIVVLAPNDTTDETLTARLQQFLLSRGAAIFYNDIPNPGDDAPTSNCTSPGSDTYCHRNSYFPVFATHTEMYGCPAGIATCPVPGFLPARTRSNGERIYRRGGFYNNREDAWVYMLTVNLNQLLDWNRAQPSGSRLIENPDDTTQGGIVLFLTVKGPNSTGTLPNGRRYGVRVYGSPNFDFPPSVTGDPTGVTIVSDQAVYVEGNYNLGPGQPGYDTNFPKQPAAIMADTINVLSSNWSGRTDSGWTGSTGCRNDCQSRKSLNSPAERPAATTYVNAAFLSFVPNTVGSNYNGGLENYPRFHEKWSGLNLVYRGSFVSLGQPSRANGSWCGTGGSSSSGCNIYDPPGRQWNYDPDFQELVNLPPITPRVVSVEQILFTENFR